MAVPVLALHNPWLCPRASLESFLVASVSGKESVVFHEDLDVLGMAPNSSIRPSPSRCASFSMLVGLMHSAELSVHGYSVYLCTSPSSYNTTRKWLHGVCSICGTNDSAMVAWMFPPLLCELGVIVQGLWNGGCSGESAQDVADDAKAQ